MLSVRPPVRPSMPEVVVHRREFPNLAVSLYPVASLLFCSSSLMPDTSLQPVRSQSSSPHKQSQNSFAAAAMMDGPTPAQSPFSHPSAKDIQLLLSNIGVRHTASLPTIESMIQSNVGDNGDLSLVDLIAQIRSI